jgi:cAMP-dependent protein kinase regulator
MLADLYAQRQAPQPRLTPTPAPLVPEAGALPRIPLFSQLGREAFVAVLEGLALRSFPAGATLVREGEFGSAMYALVEGRVEVVRQQEGGAPRTVASLGEGDFFGELALLSKGRRLASVVATEPTVVLELTRAQVEQLVERYPSMGQVLQAFYQERLLANALRSNPLFSALPPLQREAMARAFQVDVVPAGQPLLAQGQPAQALYLLLRGQCQVVQRHPNGRELTCARLREGDLFGELSLLLGLVATASVYAETPCTLLRLEREALECHVLSQSGVRAALTRLGAERLERTARLLSEDALSAASAC